jgi:hypothetical protein
MDMGVNQVVEMGQKTKSYGCQHYSLSLSLSLSNIIQ